MSSSVKIIQEVFKEKFHILKAAVISILKAISIGPKVLCSGFWELALDEEFSTCELCSCRIVGAYSPPL